MSKVLVDRELLELLQERLDPHRDAAAWGALCDALRRAQPAAEGVNHWSGLKLAAEVAEQSAPGEVEEVVVVYDPDSRSYEEHTLSISATKGSRKSLGIQNAKLKSKIGRLCIQNNELRKELDKHSSDLEAAYKAGLSARGFAGIPEDWSVTKDGESILLRHAKGSAVELNSNGPLCDRVIYGFIRDLLAAP